jgi:hypothetical protein
MKIITVTVRGIINVLLFMFYSLFFVIASNFTYWLVLKKILWKSVPWTEDPIHLKFAIIVLFWTFIITILFRKFFYIPLKSKKWD